MRHLLLAEDISPSQVVPSRMVPADEAESAEVQGVPASVSSEIEPSIIAHYFHEVRRFPLLSHEGEMTLAQQIQDGTQQWRDELLQRLLHVPFSWPVGPVSGVVLCLWMLCASQRVGSPSAR